MDLYLPVNLLSKSLPSCWNAEEQDEVVAIIAVEEEDTVQCTLIRALIRAIITHLSCNCGESDTHSSYRQSLVSIRASTIYFTSLTLFHNIHAHVIDSCIEVIIGLPDIRSYRLVHRIPSYFDTPDPAYLDTQIRQEHGKKFCQSGLKTTAVLRLL